MLVIESYFICATPRTGSSLLLGLLESTGLAGRPEAYFREPDEQRWAGRWGIAGPDDYPAFVRAARAAGTTPNGVFGAKLMWGTLDEVVSTRGILTHLGLDPAAGRPVRPRHRRQADRLNEDWARRYRAEAAR